MAGSSLPAPRDAVQDRPTLVYSWWCTIFSSLLILARLAARKIRVDKLFLEDKIMALTIIPMFIRMGLVHMVLEKGTNNVNPLTLSASQITDRIEGSKLVLGARIFFALTLWCSQAATLEFILRNFVKGSHNTRKMLFIAVRAYFGVSFLISTLAILFGCSPIADAWQVTPSPPAMCREGLPGFVSTGVFTIITNIISVIYPVMVVSGLRLSLSRKILLNVMFCAPLVLVLVTSIRLPSVITRDGNQQYRTVWASTEIITEIFTGNMLILGSYARGTGAKRVKYYGGRSDPSQVRVNNNNDDSDRRRTYYDEDSKGVREITQKPITPPVVRSPPVTSPVRATFAPAEDVETQCYHE